jgi:hypothetical protein
MNNNHGRVLIHEFVQCIALNQTCEIFHEGELAAQSIVIELRSEFTPSYRIQTKQPNPHSGQLCQAHTQQARTALLHQGGGRWIEHREHAQSAAISGQ